MARDAQDRPAILRHRLGDGWTYLCTYPIEAFASASYEVNPEPTWRIYDALAEVAGVHRPLRVHDPRITVATLGRDDGSAVHVVGNLADETVTFEVEGVLPGTRTFGPYEIEIHDTRAAGH